MIYNILCQIVNEKMKTYPDEILGNFAKLLAEAGVIISAENGSEERHTRPTITSFTVEKKDKLREFVNSSTFERAFEEWLEAQEGSAPELEADDIEELAKEVLGPDKTV